MCTLWREVIRAPRPKSHGTNGTLEKKELTLRELVQRSGLDQPTVDNICKNMEEAIEAKNSILRNLKYSLAHATKAYNGRLVLARSIEEKRLATNRELEYNRLLGASQFGRMTAFSAGRLEDLKTMLNRR